VQGTEKMPIITMALTAIPMPSAIKPLVDFRIMILQRIVGLI
jgi:hypothetical protein